MIGQNGSGKTTLAKHLNGLLKPSRGNVIVYGTNTRQVPIAFIVKHVGYVFQNPDHQICNSTINDELAFRPRNLGLSERDVAERVGRWRKALDLENVKERHPFFLTKAERQRLAVASVLAMQPSILIVDEPTRGMDMSQSLRTVSFLLDLNKSGRTVVVITHNMRLVAEYARRTVVMNDGRVIADGETRKVFSMGDVLKEAFLRPPEITELGASLRNYGVTGTYLNVDELYSDILLKMNRTS